MTRLLLVASFLAACATSPGPAHPRAQGDCGAHETAAACADEAGCRYIAPGCAEGDEVALPAAAAGCYSTTPCSEGTCAGGTVCKEVIVNPCPPDVDGNTCDACGEPLRVCVGP